jgi:hypothetical protein
MKHHLVNSVFIKKDNKEVREHEIFPKINDSNFNIGSQS